jgi:hypothetical protein
MEKILARSASFIGHTFVGSDNGVADCAFSFAGHGGGDVVSEEDEAVYYCL